ncbi:MAG TPA: site-specific DNA-methyltransferase [Candidatus Hydrogenedentes bacterium]|nr:site-specific DNA-methyltransferase [Candidatus Hydrogenedentota bacterium]
MQIDEGTYKRLPAHLQALFERLPNPSSDEVTELMPQAKAGTAVRHNSGGNTFGGTSAKPPMDDMGYADSGSAARFFYCAKASKRDRDEGCEGIEAKRGGSLNIRTDNHSQANGMDTGPRRNHHPTVKPLALMRYLCRLVTPPGGVVLDPFMGSGSTGKAAILEARQFLGIELQPEYVQIATARLSHAVKLHQESSAQQNLL